MERFLEKSKGIFYIYIYCYWIEGKREGERERDLFHFVIQIICICDIIHEACIIFRAYVLYVKCTIRVWIIKHGIVLKIKIMNEYKYSKKKKEFIRKDRSIHRYGQSQEGDRSRGNQLGRKDQKDWCLNIEYPNEENYPPRKLAQKLASTREIVISRI